MFDSLLGRKFTVRCKQAIKCINERLKVIRNRKQAMLNFLRQDIADLLRDGHDSNALNRRECPAEEKEAVSTLIFAAARFSDLPELCNLRRTFMSRYGSAMETSVSLEFIEKLASRTFSMASKIQFMQKIALEFSLEWVSEPLEYGSSGSVASQCANGKYGDKNEGMCRAPINTIKDVVLADTKDILVIDLEPDPTGRSKIRHDELENVNPYPPDTSIPHYDVHPKRDKDGRYTSPRDKVLDQIDQEGKVLDGSKVPPLKDATDSDGYRKKSVRDQDEFEDDVNPVKIPPYLKSKAVKGGALHSDDWDKDESPKESSVKAGKDAGFAASQGRQMDGPCKSYHDRSQFHMIPPPYLKSKVSARNRSSNVGNEDPQRDELVVDHERPKPRSVRRNKKSPVADQESDDAVDSDEPMRGGIQHGQRRHDDAARKNSTSPHQDEYGSEEEDIDRLLTHYSKKKTPHRSRKHREKTGAGLADHARDRCGVDQQQSSGSAQSLAGRHPVERAATFPPDPLDVGKVEGRPERVTSMQPDALSPSGGLAHPNLPDYEEFAARFAALRRVRIA